MNFRNSGELLSLFRGSKYQLTFEISGEARVFIVSAAVKIGVKLVPQYCGPFCRPKIRAQTSVKRHLSRDNRIVGRQTRASTAPSSAVLTLITMTLVYVVNTNIQKQTNRPFVSSFYPVLVAQSIIVISSLDSLQSNSENITKLLSALKLSGASL